MRLPLTMSLFIISLLLAVRSLAQSDEQVRAILYLSGAESMESLDEQELEKYAGLLSRPLEINFLNQSKLASCGLMSPYQAASLSDYKARNGDILSYVELAMVDGFSEEYVAALKPFISLRSSRLPGEAGSPPEISQDIELKGGVRNGKWSGGVKYKISYKESLDFSAAVRTAYSENEPSYSFSTAFHGRRFPFNVILGDFNARFGQGLCMWNGFSLSGFSSSASFMRRATGLSQSRSYSSASHRGLAADAAFGRFRVSCMVSLGGLRSRMENGGEEDVEILPAANVAWQGADGQLGATLSWGRKAGIDFRWTMQGIDLFGEAAWDMMDDCVAGVAGGIFPLGGELRLSAALRYYPEDFDTEYTGGVRSWSRTSNEYAVSAGLEWRGFIITADLAKRVANDDSQGKFLVKMPFQLGRNMVLSLKAAERLRPGEALRYRTDVRLDLDYSSSGLSSVYGIADGTAWIARFRLEGLLCRSLGSLAYLECGRRNGSLSTYLRCTAFRIDDWEDRIYSYERDAPGNFSVPAYYGRGFSLVWTGGWRILLNERPWRYMRIYAKASSVRYSRSSKKGSRSEIKLQLAFDL